MVSFIIYALNSPKTLNRFPKGQLPTVPSSSKTLRVSYVGMVPQTVTIKQGVINVVLKSDAKAWTKS